MLRDADRAEAAPWIEFPATPWWYVPIASIWIGGVVLALSYRSMLLFFALVAAELLFLTWYRRCRGMWPTGPAPREYRRPITLAGASIFASLGVAAVVWLFAGPWGSAITMAVLSAAILTWYERAYADAARRTRERLG